MMLIIFGIIFFISVLTFYIWHQIEAVRLGYEIGKLEEEIAKLRKEVEELETTKSHLLSPELVEKIAKEDLKMVKPKDNQIVYEDFEQ